MKSHQDLSDEAFEQAFASCELSPELFNHEAHLRLAWLQIRKYGLEQALINIQEQLLTYVTQLGAQDKYHQTLTIAAVHAVHHFMQLSEGDSFPSFIVANPQLATSFKELVNSHYSFDVFSHKEARKRYLEPDLQPF